MNNFLIEFNYDKHGLVGSLFLSSIRNEYEATLILEILKECKEKTENLDSLIKIQQEIKEILDKKNVLNKDILQETIIDMVWNYNINVVIKTLKETLKTNKTNG